MGTPEILTKPDGETKSSFIKSRLLKLNELEILSEKLLEDAKHFDNETKLRIVAIKNAISIVKKRIDETKRKGKK